jgi:hypothetical protein
MRDQLILDEAAEAAAYLYKRLMVVEREVDEASMDLSARVTLFSGQQATAIVAASMPVILAHAAERPGREQAARTAARKVMR